MNREQKIKSIYDGIRLINQTEDAHWVETPASLVDEMISNINLDGKILVLFNVDIMMLLLKIYEVPASDIIFLSDDSAKDYLCDQVGVKYINSIEEIKEMNIILGNLWREKNKKGWKRLMDQLVKKSFELTDTVAMITPQSITAPSNFSLIKDKVTTINIDISKHFNVRKKKIAYFIAHNAQKTSNTRLITDNGEFEQDIKDFGFLPIIINDITLDQINWLKQRQSRKWKRGEFHTSNKKKVSNKGKYEVIHTNAQTKRTSVDHENIGKVRVCVSLSGNATFHAIKDKGCSQATVWTEFDTVKEAEDFATECNGEYIQSIMKNFKWSGWSSKEVIDHL